MPGLVLLRGQFQVHLASGGTTVQRNPEPGELPAVELLTAGPLRTVHRTISVLLNVFGRR